MELDSRLIAQYSELSDLELLAILTYRSSGYTQQAIEVARREAWNRGGPGAVNDRVLRGPMMARKVLRTTLLVVGMTLVYAGVLQALFSLVASRITTEVLFSIVVRGAVGLLLIWFGARKWLGSRRALGYALLILGVLSIVPAGSSGATGRSNILISLAIGILALALGALALFWHRRVRRALESTGGFPSN